MWTRTRKGQSVKGRFPDFRVNTLRRLPNPTQQGLSLFNAISGVLAEHYPVTVAGTVLEFHQLPFTKHAAPLIGCRLAIKPSRVDVNGKPFQPDQET